jgi:hypothetical protein
MDCIGCKLISSPIPSVSFSLPESLSLPSNFENNTEESTGKNLDDVYASFVTFICPAWTQDGLGTLSFVDDDLFIFAPEQWWYMLGTDSTVGFARSYGGGKAAAITQ